MTPERIKSYEKIRKVLTEAPLLLILEWNITFKLYIYSCGYGLGEALHQVKIIDDKPTEGPVCYISRKIKPTEARYGEGQMEFLCFVWALEKLHYYLYGSFFEIAIQEYRANMTIVHEAGNIHKNSDGLSMWALGNTPDSPSYVPLEAEPPIPIERINRTYISTELFEEVGESYKQYKNWHILT
ncbi:hypothetical protein O181_029600 [Austropuccinia psidii MF-1]|uniref:Reverse transcriptase/retrotransposon-derived protein RNase H-like domain-containing protein n=1 Tax=Austropuccinia psidii MF-1 TaxID=1389203 RepID=A0A9Q3CUQ7_9BASI|nr:hypothetical protein [Austropuccinia psidii MF-1]